MLKHLDVHLCFYTGRAFDPTKSTLIPTWAKHNTISKASVMRMKGLEMLGKVRTDCLINVVCRF